MKDTNPRIALYKEAISLEERRAALQAQVDEVGAKLAAIKSQLFDSFAPAHAPRAAAAPAAKAAPREASRASAPGAEN
jgi:hypothetical protein